MLTSRWLWEISIHALREEGDHILTPDLQRWRISIHALREEGDEMLPFLEPVATNFYPRPPRGGRRSIRAMAMGAGIFLSTPSARRATPSRMPPTARATFLSTPSARRATYGPERLERLRKISIHALREEGDKDRTAPSAAHHDFYPRPPRGGRPVVFSALPALAEFLSTPSARRATRVVLIINQLIIISIHALREEGDIRPVDNQSTPNDFYPRPPRGGRRSDRAAGGRNCQFLSTPSARRATHRLRR